MKASEKEKNEAGPEKEKSDKKNLEPEAEKETKVNVSFSSFLGSVVSVIRLTET
jgi:hypothetical protein